MPAASCRPQQRDSHSKILVGDDLADFHRSFINRPRTQEDRPGRRLQKYCYVAGCPHACKDRTRWLSCCYSLYKLIGTTPKPQDGTESEIVEIWQCCAYVDENNLCLFDDAIYILCHLFTVFCCFLRARQWHSHSNIRDGSTLLVSISNAINVRKHYGQTTSEMLGL